MLKENLALVEEKIQAACNRVSRNREDVTLIAVSKTKPVSMIQEVMDLGITDFGENKVQELTDKIDKINQPLDWHFIGHLQRNKVKYIIDKTCLIHSVDSLRLAETINKEAIKKDVIMPILIEVNIAGEETKYGVREEEVYGLITEISKLSNVRVKGLMTIAPFVSNPEDNRIHFRKLRQLSVDIGRFYLWE